MTNKELQELLTVKKTELFYYLSPEAAEELDNAIRKEILNQITLEVNDKEYYYSKSELDEYLQWQNKMRNLAFRFDSKNNNE